MDLTLELPWDQAFPRPASVDVLPGAETPPGSKTAGISVGSGPHSQEAGRRQAGA